MRPMNRERGRLIGPLVLGAIGLVTAGAGVASEQAELVSVHIRYEVADLAQPGGAQRLYGRIRRAARDVCREPDQRELTLYKAYEVCFDRAVDDAVASVDMTALTALHRSRAQRSATG